MACAGVLVDLQIQNWNLRPTPLPLLVMSLLHAETWNSSKCRGRNGCSMWSSLPLQTKPRYPRVRSHSPIESMSSFPLVSLERKPNNLREDRPKNMVGIRKAKTAMKRKGMSSVNEKNLPRSANIGRNPMNKMKIGTMKNGRRVGNGSWANGLVDRIRTRVDSAEGITTT